MVRLDLVKQRKGSLPNKWYYRMILFLTGFSLLLTVVVGWTGLLVMTYAVVLYLNGRGKMIDDRNDINLRGGFLLKRYDRRGA